MKRILFFLPPILLSLAFLGHAKNGTTSTAADAVRIATADSRSGITDEELTEKNFYDFIRFDIIGKDKPVTGGTLHYAGFSDATEAYGKIIDFIAPASARIKFHQTKSYDSALLTVRFAENDADGGFACLEATFLKRADLGTCKIVFEKN